LQFKDFSVFFIALQLRVVEFVGKVNNGGQPVSRAGMSWEISEEGKPAIDMVAAPMCMEACIRHMLTLEVEERAVDFPSLSAFLGDESEGTFERCVCLWVYLISPKGGLVKNEHFLGLSKFRKSANQCVADKGMPMSGLQAPILIASNITMC